LEVSGAVRPIYGSLGVKTVNIPDIHMYFSLRRTVLDNLWPVWLCSIFS